MSTLQPESQRSDEEELDLSLIAFEHHLEHETRQKIPFDITRHHVAVLADACVQVARAEYARRSLQKRRKGRPRHTHVDAFIETVAGVFADATGSQPTLSKNPITHEVTSNFAVFLSAVWNEVSGCDETFPEADFAKPSAGKRALLRRACTVLPRWKKATI